MDAGATHTHTLTHSLTHREREKTTLGRRVSEGLGAGRLASLFLPGDLVSFFELLQGHYSCDVVVR